MSNGLSVKRASLLALLEGFVTSLDDETLTKLSEQQLLMTLRALSRTSSIKACYECGRPVIVSS